jgi:hypothetical protein
MLKLASDDRAQRGHLMAEFPVAIPVSIKDSPFRGKTGFASLFLTLM